MVRCPEDDFDGIVEQLSECFYSERDRYWVCFEGIEVTYVDENYAISDVEFYD